MHVQLTTTPLFRTRIFRVPLYFDLQFISLGSAPFFESFYYAYFELGYFEFPAYSN